MPGFPSIAAGLPRADPPHPEFRLEWAYQMLAREVRVTDSTLIGNLVTSVTFYANTTIYIIAGLVAALGAADKLLNFTADLAFAGAGNRELLEIKLMLVLASFVYAYFKFTWSLRQFNLLSILVGAAPLGERGEPASSAMRSGGRRQQPGRRRLQSRHPRLLLRPRRLRLAAQPAAARVLALLILVVLYRRDYRSARSTSCALEPVSRPPTGRHRLSACSPMACGDSFRSSSASSRTSRRWTC
jgi:uncharacterized membrane protein